MATQVYASGNYFYLKLENVTETLNDNKTLVNVWRENNTTNSFVIQSPKIGRRTFLLSDLEDQTGTAYTLPTFTTFYENNTGLGSAGGSAIPTQDHIFENAVARDTFFSSNLSDLITGTPIFVGNVDLGGGVTGTQLQEWAGANNPPSYDNTQWAVGGIIALTAPQIKSLYESNLDTNNFDDLEKSLIDSIQLVSDTYIPRKGGTSLVNSSLRETSTQVISSKTLVAPDASLRIGNWQQSNGGFTIQLQELASGAIFYPVTTELETQGTTVPFYWQLGAQVTTPAVADKSETFTGTSIQFMTPSVNSGIVNSYTYDAVVATQDVNLVVRLNSHTDAQPIFDYERATGELFNISSGENTLSLPVALFFESGVNLYVTVESVNNLQLRGQTLSGETVPYLETVGRLGTKINVTQDHPTTVRRDMPSEEDALKLVNVSLNGNSAHWLVANNQLTSSNRADATIRALISGQLDLDGNEIPLTPVAANTIQLRAGTEVRVFGANDYRVITSPIVNSELQTIRDDIATLQNTAFNSGRSFVRFNDGFTIDRTNLAVYEDKNIIYTAKNDKPITNPLRPDVILPNDTEIQASGESYPIVFEFTHLGGTQRFSDNSANVVRFFLDGVMFTRILQRDEVAIVIKPSAGQDYEFQIGGFNPSDTVLPTGVFNLKTDTPINDISTISTELSGVTIVAGDAYLVETGGSWSGFTVPDNSILVAVVNNASLSDSATNDDWLLLDNPRVNAKSSALLANFNQDGIVFEANRNIKIDDTNVTIFNSMATGTPITRQLLTNTQGFNRQIRYDNIPIQLSDIVGGKLQMMFSIQTTSSSGFEIEPIDITLHYSDTIQFVFPLNNFEIDSGNVLLEIEIPNSDYSSILNTNVSLRFNFNFRGAVYNGNMTISGLLNIAKGNLHDSIVSISDQRAQLVRAELDTRITNLIGDIDDEHQSLEAIEYRISPIRTVSINTPDSTARFADDTGGAFPTSPTELNPENPQFESSGTSVFVYTVGGGTYALKNVTQNTILALESGTSIASTTIGSLTYFVHRVTVSISDILEVEVVNSSNVVAWQDDINRLKDGLNRIDSELEHTALNLPDALIQVLDNEVTVTEESNPTIISTQYNNSLGNTQSQTIFYESNPNSPSGGVIASKPISDTSGDRARRKLIYYPDTTTFNNEATLSAFDGTNGTDLIRYSNGVFNAQVFVPATSSGTSSVTLYPAPSNRVSGSGIWQNIPALTFINGIPVTEADELFFTRNIPAENIPIKIDYRGHANGNIFGLNSVTLQANQESTTFVLNDGSEQAIVEIRRYTNNTIRVSVTERVNTGLPTINDVEVILSYQENRVIPAVPSTTREVLIENISQGYQVFAIKPSSTNTLILVGDSQEIDTGYLYTTLFGASEGGHLISAEETSTFLDYQTIEPITTTIEDLENHAGLPQFGLFSTQYTHATIVELGTQLIVTDSSGDRYNVGDALKALGASSL